MREWCKRGIATSGQRARAASAFRDLTATRGRPGYAQKATRFYIHKIGGVYWKVYLACMHFVTLAQVQVPHLSAG